MFRDAAITASPVTVTQSTQSDCWHCSRNSPFYRWGKRGLEVEHVHLRVWTHKGHSKGYSGVQTLIMLFVHFQDPRVSCYCLVASICFASAVLPSWDTAAGDHPWPPSTVLSPYSWLPSFPWASTILCRPPGIFHFEIDPIFRKQVLGSFWVCQVSVGFEREKGCFTISLLSCEQRTCRSSMLGSVFSLRARILWQTGVLHYFPVCGLCLLNSTLSFTDHPDYPPFLFLSYNTQRPAVWVRIQNGWLLSPALYFVAWACLLFWNK